MPNDHRSSAANAAAPLAAPRARHGGRRARWPRMKSGSSDPSFVRERWPAAASAVVVCAVAIAVGSLLLTTYTLSLGDPVPHRIDTAVVGNPGAHASVVEAIDHAAGGELDFHPYP